MPTAVLVTAHPDDSTSVAGTLGKLHERGFDLYELLLTDGRRGKAPADGADTAQTRLAEERAAASVVNMSLECYGAEDSGGLWADKDTVEWLAQHLEKLQPDVVFAHAPIDVIDHAAAHQATMRALHAVDLYYRSEIYLFEAQIGGQTNRFDPDLYINTDTTYHYRDRMMRCHESQWGDEAFRFLEKMTQARGWFARCKYAEGFCTVLPMTDRRWGRPAEVGRLLID